MPANKIILLFLILIFIIILSTPSLRILFFIQFRQIIPMPSTLRAVTISAWPKMAEPYTIWQGWESFKPWLITPSRQKVEKIVQSQPKDWQIHQAWADCILSAPELFAPKTIEVRGYRKALKQLSAILRKGISPKGKIPSELLKVQREVEKRRQKRERKITEPAIKEYQKALALNPKSALLHYRLALVYFRLIHFTRQAEGVWPFRPSPPPHSNPKYLAAASRELRKAMELEPENALYNYLLAFILLEEHKDTEALEMIKQGNKKPQFNFYWKETILSGVKLFQASGVPPLEARVYAIIISMDTVVPTIVPLRSTAQILTALGTKYQQKGEHSKAIEYYCSVVEMGKKMRTQAWGALEALSGVAIEAIGCGRFRPKPEQYTSANGEKDWRKYTRLLDKNFTQYLTKYERFDLAQKYANEQSEAYAFKKHLIDLATSPEREAKDARLEPNYFWLVQTIILAQALVVFALTVLGLLIWLPLRKKEILHISWNWLNISILFLISLVPVIASLIIFGIQLMPLPPHPPFPEIRSETIQVFVFLGPLFLLFFVACRIFWLLKRAKRGIIKNFILPYLKSLYRILPIALTFLLIVYLLLFVPLTYFRSQALEYRDQQIQYGEISLLLKTK